MLNIIVSILIALNMTAAAVAFGFACGGRGFIIRLIQELRSRKDKR
jgi:ABC-type uncharacterized transport system YnjBCD permease subunit